MAKNLFDDNDPMARREFLDHHESLPFWVIFLSRLRLALGI